MTEDHRACPAPYFDRIACLLKAHSPANCTDVDRKVSRHKKYVPFMWRHEGTISILCANRKVCSFCGDRRVYSLYLTTGKYAHYWQQQSMLIYVSTEMFPPYVATERYPHVATGNCPHYVATGNDVYYVATPYEDPLSASQPEPLSTVVKRRRWRRLGHVLRMPSDSLTSGPEMDST